MGIRMADRSDFRVIPGKADAKASFSKKIRMHRTQNFLRFVLISAIVVGLTVWFVTQYKNQVFSGFVISKQAEFTVLDTTSYLENNGNIIRYSKDGISNTDAKGKMVWNLTYEMQSPMVRRAEGYTAVGDYNGHIIYLVDKDGTPYEIDTRLPISNFAVSSTGVVAAILEEAGNSWINVFNKDGTQIVESKATMSKTGYPLAVSLSNEVMGVSYFYVDGSTMRSSVTFYNFGGVGENTTDHIVSSYAYTDAVVPMIQFMGEESSFAVADNRLMFFEGSKKPVSVADILLDVEIQGVYYSDTHVGLLFYDQTGEHKYCIDVYDASGKKVMSYGFDMDFKDILIHNDQIMIYNESKCMIVGLNGKLKYSGNFEERVHFAAPTDSPRKFVLIIEDGLATMEFN